jgi:hypothetical protein
MRSLDMSHPRFNGLAIFALFFGAAMLEAVRTHDWVKMIFWLAMGSGFLLADSLRKRTSSNKFN